MRVGTIALVVRVEGQESVLVEAISDDQEINVLESAIRKGDPHPLDHVRDHRVRLQAEDEQFGDYVEELISKPFVRWDIREHGVQWFHARIRIEEYRRHEEEAVSVIAKYALKVFQDSPEKADFFLVGPKAKVRVRVFKMRNEALGQGKAA